MTLTPTEWYLVIGMGLALLCMLAPTARRSLSPLSMLIIIALWPLVVVIALFNIARGGRKS